MTEALIWLLPLAGITVALLILQSSRRATAKFDSAHRMAHERAAGMREAAHFVGREAGGFPDNVAWAVEDLAKSIIARADEIERNVE